MTALTYLTGLICVGVVLFAIALIMPKLKQPQKDNSAQKIKQLDALCQTCQALLPDYHIRHNNKYISLTKNQSIIALITLDAKLNTHTRKMGDHLIINFKHLPSTNQLEQTLLEHHIIYRH